MNEQKNLFLAIGLSVAIIIIFQFLMPPTQPIQKSNIENNEIKETRALPEKSSTNKEINMSEEVKTVEVKTAEVKTESTNQKKIKKNKPKIDNVVKDIEYLTTDKSGNRYKILASSGRTNSEDKNVLDLDYVRGTITSKDKSTVYIVSDFAEYNSSNLKSNFYQNVVINYEDKQITCDYFICKSRVVNKIE